MNLVLLKGISIVGVYWGGYLTKEQSHVPVVWGELLSLVPVQLPQAWSLTLSFSLLASGTLRPVVYSEVFPLERISDGLAVLESRKSWGKVITRVRDDDSSNAKARL